MTIYLAIFYGEVPKLREISKKSCLDGRLNVPIPGQFETITRQYEFTAETDDSALSKARKRIAEYYPDTQVKLAGLYKMIHQGDKK